MDTLRNLLDEKTKRLESLTAPEPVTSYDGRSSLCLLLGVVFLVGGIGGCVVDSGPGGWDGWPVMSLIGVAVSILAGVFMMQAEKKAAHEKLPLVEQLEQEIEDLEEKLRTSEELTKIESELVALNPERFGCKSTDELRKLRGTRSELIGRIMGSCSC